MTRNQQIARVAQLLRIKAATCRSLAGRTADLEKTNWNGVADEIDDMAWSLEELAAGRDVAALIQGEKNRKRERHAAP